MKHKIAIDVKPITNYLADIGSSPASSKTADAINQYLPERKHIVRQTVDNWLKRKSADDGIFYALLHYAPTTSREYQLAKEAIELLDMVADEDSSVS